MDGNKALKEFNDLKMIEHMDSVIKEHRLDDVEDFVSKAIINFLRAYDEGNDTAFEFIDVYARLKREFREKSECYWLIEI